VKQSACRFRQTRQVGRPIGRPDQRIVYCRSMDQRGQTSRDDPHRRCVFGSHGSACRLAQARHWFL